MAEFFAGRGLELSQAKTRIVHIDDGFDFLGFNLRHFPDSKLLVRPQKEKVALHRRQLSAFFRINRQMPMAEVIKQLSAVIRGWCNYCRYAWPSARSPTWTTTFGGHLQVGQTPPSQENQGWVSHRYYGVDEGRGWDLWDGRYRLPRHNETRVTRFVEGQGQASPFDPSLRDYWEDRRLRRLVREAGHFNRIHLLQRQAGRCAACKTVFDPDLGQTPVKARNVLFVKRFSAPADESVKPRCDESLLHPAHRNHCALSVCRGAEAAAGKCWSAPVRLWPVLAVTEALERRVHSMIVSCSLTRRQVSLLRPTHRR